MSRDVIVMLVFAAFLIGAIMGGWVISIAIGSTPGGKDAEAHSRD